MVQMLGPFHRTLTFDLLNDHRNSTLTFKLDKLVQNKVKASENSCLHNFHIVFITRLYQDNKVLLDMVLYLGQG